MDTLARQFTPSNFAEPQRQRLYLKDIDTPEVWAEHLQDVLPESLFYLNDCIEPRLGGDGAIREPNEYGQMRFGRGAAIGGDLMSSLPPEMRALNMMCYIGHEGTYTPAHREMCASLGQNIMVETSRNQHGEKAGTSIWFMTETKEREVVSEYFLSMLGHDIEVEKHFAQINAWKKAPFNVWVVEQKIGDLVLIPPLAPHQVWNRGTRTMKAAWNRTTVDTLELAIHEALPRARMVCRDEQYKNKAIIYYSLVKYYELLERPTIEEKMWKYGRIKQILDDFRRLFALYTEILINEMFSPSLPTEQDVEFLPFDSNVTCSYCRCNIFNRFLTCKSCIETAPIGEEDTYDVCMECYAMGRSCACISKLTWVEQWDWSALTEKYELWRGKVVDADEEFIYETSPMPLDIARDRYGKKSVAQICQEQLKIRPWHDITKPVVPEPFPGESDVEPEVDDEGRPKKKTPSKRGRWRRAPVKDKTHTCHICLHHDWNWRLAFCTTCSCAYCYGVLWRAFDLMPQEVMEKKDWQCPKCLKMCSCGKCRKNPSQIAYAPRGTLLGHDTRKVADFRSVESLVDFSKTNLGWLRGENDANPKESARMKKLKEKAEVEKARPDTFDESYLVAGSQHAYLDAAPEEVGGPSGFVDEIDPLLNSSESSLPSYGGSNGLYQSPYTTTDPATNFNSNGNLLSDNADGNIDGHYDLEFDSYNRPGTTYPSRLLASVAPMFISNASYVDSPQLGNNRMMGIGYYQQDNGVDKILYDAPNSTETSEDTSTLEPSENPNLALSDLVGPLGETSKKKRRLGEDGAVIEEEFFSSKRQKKLAEAKKLSTATKPESDVDLVSSKPRGSGRPPCSSKGKPQSYADLGEDVNPDLELDYELHLARKQVVDGEDDVEFDDFELAAQAMSRFSNDPAKEKAAKKAIRMKPSTSPAVGHRINKTGRKSAWLARRKAEESEDFPAELPSVKSRTPGASARKETSKAKSPSTEEPSDFGYDHGGVRINDSDGGSLFEEPHVPGRAAAGKAIKWRVSDDDPNVKVAEPADNEYDEKPMPAPRRRGRPPKDAKSISATKARAPIKILSVSQSPSSEETRPGPITKLLSLKEKLALKGRSFKIVAAKSQKPLSSGPPSAQNVLAQAITRESFESPSVTPSVRSTPSVVVRSVLGGSPMASSREVSVIANTPEEVESRPEPSPVTSPVRLQNGKTASIATEPAKSIRKGPTVVRLLSSEPESEPDAESEASLSTDSSDDDDIPAVLRPPSTHAGVSMTGSGVPNGTAIRGGVGIGRGRGRGRPPLNHVQAASSGPAM